MVSVSVVVWVARVVLGFDSCPICQIFFTGLWSQGCYQELSESPESDHNAPESGRPSPWVGDHQKLQVVHGMGTGTWLRKALGPGPHGLKTGFRRQAVNSTKAWLKTGVFQKPALLTCFPELLL